MNPAVRSSAIAATFVAAALLAACSSHRPEEDPVLQTWEQSRWNQLFEFVDVDGDGSVTRAEFQANYVQVTWIYFDKNGDGVLTGAEWAIDGNSRERREWFETLDANDDLFVTRAEFDRSMTPAGTDRFFELMDADGDGGISMKDIQPTS